MLAYLLARAKSLVLCARMRNPRDQRRRGMTSLRSHRSIRTAHSIALLTLFLAALFLLLGIVGLRCGARSFLSWLLFRRLLPCVHTRCANFRCGAWLSCHVSGLLLSALLATVLARGGGAAVHGVLPAMWREGTAPTPAQLATSADAGLFSAAGAQSAGSSLALEYEVLLEVLAFFCTYGKRNCITSEMYAGEVCALRAHLHTCMAECSCCSVCVWVSVAQLSLGKIVRLVWSKVGQGVLSCG